MYKVKCDCCQVEVEISLGQYIEARHEFICNYCLEEMYASGPEDIYSYEVH
jgi:hypothetical protein